MLGARLGRGDRGRLATDAARRRAAVEIVARHEAALKRTARRYSLDAADAEDAYQRALEIVLTKAPTTDLRELIRWTQTVTKHEALAVRESRERLLGYRAVSDRESGNQDPVARLATGSDGPDEQVQRREAVARSREALRALKPAELRALTLLAEGYSYAEIGEITGFSPTKVNRVLAEGRDRFRRLLSSSEDGTRCRELHPLLSAFCDGEASLAEAATVREHLRACASCRATMRAYRAAPRAAAALTPLLPPSRSLLERALDLVTNLASRLPGTGGAKLATACVGVAGGACAVTGVLPAPLPLGGADRDAAVERSATKHGAAEQAAQREPAPKRPPKARPDHQPEGQAPPVEEASLEAPSTTTEPVEYEAPPPPSPAPPPAGEAESAGSSTASGSPAGEFGP